MSRTPIDGRVRYAVVGLGHIAQVAVLPAFAHATENSRLTALVSDDAEKLSTLTRKYGVPHAFMYEEYDALPRGGRCGVHRASQLDARRVRDQGGRGRRPRAVREADGGDRRGMRADDRAAQATDVRLMIAYRLHFEHADAQGDRARVGAARSAIRSSSTRRFRCGCVLATFGRSARWAAVRSTTSASTASTPLGISSEPSRLR